jgi:hypothetical protein
LARVTLDAVQQVVAVWLLCATAKPMSVARLK